MSAAQQTAETTASPAQSETALSHIGVGRRAVAIIIDSFVLLIPYFILGFLIGSITGETGGGGFQLEGGSAFLLMGLLGLIGFGYFILLEAYYGQTVGKRLVGVRVVSVDGTAIGFSDSVMRNVLRIIDGIAVYLLGALFIWLSDDNQRIGDRVGNTVVVSS